MTRPRRSFQSLLLQALVEAEAGNLGALQAEAFREEARRHLAMGPRGEDPIGQALYLGREALHRLSLGEREGACAKLLQALRLHPYLGGGYAARLVEVLCGEGVAVKPPLQGEFLLASPEALLAARVLAFLDGLPPEFWGEVLRGPRRPPAGEERASRPSRPKGERRAPSSPSRPRFPLVYRPRYRDREEPRGEVQVLGLLSFRNEWTFGRKELRRWVGPGLEIREEDGGGFWLRLFPEFWERHPEAALLVLEGREARVPIPLLTGMPPLPFPRVFRRGEEVTGEVWSWEDLRPRALAAFLREVGYYRDLLRVWLEYGLGTGRLSWKRFREALRLLEEEP
ncbi:MULTISPECIES: hypothetical protein [Thermus]|uniref:hypothetical protein n=1 Tax=Thermus TaxID=270 RepID=UPI001FAA2072